MQNSFHVTVFKLRIRYLMSNEINFFLLSLTYIKPLQFDSCLIHIVFVTILQINDSTAARLLTAVFLTRIPVFTSSNNNSPDKCLSKQFKKFLPISALHQSLLVIMFSKYQNCLTYNFVK